MWSLGKLPRSKNISTSGTITYNGDTEKSRRFQMASLTSYVEQLDNNEPFLTVRETLEFAVRLFIIIIPSKATVHIPFLRM